jgi:hypothetical protein
MQGMLVSLERRQKGQEMMTLHTILGLVKFIEKYVLQEHVPVAKLLEVFGLVMVINRE